MSDKRSARLLTMGLVGSAITAVCCFTPVLVVLLTALTGYLDYVLFPALGIFLAITGYALIKRRQDCCPRS